LTSLSIVGGRAGYRPPSTFCEGKANLPNGNLTTINGLQPLANRSPRLQMNGRNCLACHVLVHGSNHPAGAKFSR